jgi:hypothetical protein
MLSLTHIMYGGHSVDRALFLGPFVSLMMIWTMYRVSHRVVSIRIPWSYQQQLATPNCSLLDVLSTGCNTSIESLHLSEKNPIYGNFFNALQTVSDCVESCFPIREFVSCQELLDVTEEKRDRSQRVPGQVSTVNEMLFSSRSASEIPRLLSPYAGVPYRHGRSIFDRFHRPEFCAILVTEQRYR